MKDNRLRQLFKILDEVEVYGRAIGKVDFDMQCVAPPEGLDRAGRDEAVLGKRVHALIHSKKFEKLVCSLYEDPGELTEVQRRVVELLHRDYEKSKNETAAFAFERDMAFSTAYSRWLEAKQKSDFSLFRDSLASVADYTRRTMDLRDSRPGSYYDACLDDTEHGGSEAQLDVFFGALKERIVPLMRRIKADGKHIRTDFLSRPCPIPEQEAFSRWLLELEGLRKSALVLMTTEHPFTDHYGPNDIRVTTHYYEENFISNIFSTMHEGGHALFMQNEPAELYENHAADGMTSAMHECISRFYENVIGRSEAFTAYILPELQKITGDTFADITARELYEAVNTAAPGLIRMEADELSYPLHIMIRYELEKAFVNGRIGVDEIPAAWNAKYKEYLGLDVPSDDLGCLQDVHWTGSYGYFPSYALGNAYGAQILRTMEKEIDVFSCTAKGDLKPILAWLTEKVFSIASLTTPDEWIRKITGEGLNVNYYLDYLEEKFKGVYGLK
jgi:carboxypeptidase Taq